jgi:carboxyl-terminal processing protease
MKKYSSVVAAALWFGLGSAVSARETVVSLPKAELEQLFAAYERIKAQYVDNVDDKKLLADAISGMVSSLDPHSQFLDQDDLAELEKARTGEYVGIGIEVAIDHGLINVTALTEGGPAEAAGIVPGDCIVSIDGVAVSGLRVSEVSKRMLGAPGSTVKLSLAGQARQALRVVSVARTPIHTETVKMRMTAPGLAWIRISEFEGPTLADLIDALKKVDALGEPKGLILDLRNDPGGLVTAAVGVAAAFLPADTVLFSARGRMQGTNSEVSANQRFYRMAGQPDELARLPEWTRRVPLVVLVNGASASSAELVAGALQDHGRAKVIGSQTFGKGSIQMVLPLTEGSAVKLTVARYFTPSGREIQAQGITPDVVIPSAAANMAANGVAMREADLANHLAPTADSGPASDSETVAATGKRTAAENTATFGTPSDRALKVAVATLAPHPSAGGQLAATFRRLGTWFDRSE